MIAFCATYPQSRHRFPPPLSIGTLIMWHQRPIHIHNVPPNGYDLSVVDITLFPLAHITHGHLGYYLSFPLICIFFLHWAIYVVDYDCRFVSNLNDAL